MFPGLEMGPQNKSINIEKVDNGFIIKIHNPNRINPIKSMMTDLTESMIQARERAEEPWKDMPVEGDEMKTHFTVVCKDAKEVMDVIQVELI